MKRLLLILISSCLALLSSVLYAQQLDSSVRAALDERLTEYFHTLDKESLEVQKEECDFLIGSAKDSLVRQFVALRIYDHYVSSPVMGAEAVALHVFDSWFLPGHVRMGSEFDLLNARIFADFNRQSMIGERAPELCMESLDGRMVDISMSERNGRYSVLFFYDADCSKCKVESILLRNVLETEDFPIDFYAVYAGDDRSKWESYVKDRLSVEARRTRTTHMWDPQFDSDFQRKYGVIQTPRLFLVSPQGVITGRGLDAQALSLMLHGIFDEVKLEYGSEESKALFSSIFGDNDREVAKEDVERLADYIRVGTLEKGDTVMFRQLSGDLLYYLAGKNTEGYKEGADYLIDNHILSRADVWRTADDSLKVTGFAEIMDDLLDRCVPGTEISDLKVPGRLLTPRKDKHGDYRLGKLKGGRNIIIFYTEGCHVCDAEKASASKIVASDRSTYVFMVNMDEIISDSPSLSARLFDSFDMSSLPFIVETDRKGIIRRRYVSLQNH